MNIKSIGTYLFLFYSLKNGGGNLLNINLTLKPTRYKNILMKDRRVIINFVKIYELYQ